MQKYWVLNNYLQPAFTNLMNHYFLLALVSTILCYKSVIGLYFGTSNFITNHAIK